MNPIKVEQHGSFFVARPQGDIDAANAGQVRDELAGIADGWTTQRIAAALGERTIAPLHAGSPPNRKGAVNQSSPSA